MITLRTFLQMTACPWEGVGVGGFLDGSVGFEARMARSHILKSFDT